MSEMQKCPDCLEPCRAAFGVVTECTYCDSLMDRFRGVNFQPVSGNLAWDAHEKVRSAAATGTDGIRFGFGSAHEWAEERGMPCPVSVRTAHSIGSSMFLLPAGASALLALCCWNAGFLVNIPIALFVTPLANPLLFGGLVHWTCAIGGIACLVNGFNSRNLWLISLGATLLTSWFSQRLRVSFAVSRLKHLALHNEKVFKFLFCAGALTVSRNLERDIVRGADRTYV